MSGRAIGFATVAMAGCRVSGQPTFVPGHYKNGKYINPKITIPVMVNNSRGRTDGFRLVAWGKLAEICARSCSIGKELDITGELQSYVGTLFNQDGSVRVDGQGQALQSTKTAITIEKIVFGDDSDKRIQDELARGVRPASWNIPNHPDYALWQQTLKARQAVQYDGSANDFVFARVSIPQGQGIVLGPPPQANGGMTGYANQNMPVDQAVHQAADGVVQQPVQPVQHQASTSAPAPLV